MWTSFFIDDNAYNTQNNTNMRINGIKVIIYYTD